MSRIRVEVTAEDIALGQNYDGSRCPIARAVHRAGFPDAHVARAKWFPRDRDGVAFPLSKKATAWIDRFDANKPVQPVMLVLRAPHA